MSELTAFLARYKENDNEWWKLDSGDMQNLFDEAIDRIAELEAKLRKAKGLLALLFSGCTGENGEIPERLDIAVYEEIEAYLKPKKARKG